MTIPRMTESRRAENRNAAFLTREQAHHVQRAAWAAWQAEGACSAFLAAVWHGEALHCLRMAKLIAD